MISFNLHETFTGTRVESRVVCLGDDEELENNIIPVFPGTFNRCLQPGTDISVTLQKAHSFY